MTVNVAVAVELLVRVNAGHGFVVPEHAALPPIPLQPEKLNPVPGVASKGPIVEPKLYVPEALFVPVSVPDPTIVRVHVNVLIVNVAVSVELDVSVHDAVPVPDTPEQDPVPDHPVNV